MRVRPSPWDSLDERGGAAGPAARGLGRLKRRALLIGSAAAGTSALLGGFGRKAAAAQPSLYVFLHTLLEPRALGKQFEGALPGVAVWVLTRSRDFSQVRSHHPDAVLALAPVLRANGFQAQLQGKKAGRATEPYVLLANGRVNPGALSSVGAVDILGRREMPKFVASLLGGNEPQVTPVTKLADLLALLQLGRVEAVVLPARDAEPLMKRTRLTLAVTSLSQSEVGLPAFAPVTPAGNGIASRLNALPSLLQEEIGVDSWR